MILGHEYVIISNISIHIQTSITVCTNSRQIREWVSNYIQQESMRMFLASRDKDWFDSIHGSSSHSSAIEVSRGN